MSQIIQPPPVQKSRRVEDKAHVDFVRTLPCCLTGAEGEGVQPHHLVRVPTNERGGAMKSGDDWVIPLWWENHNELHNGPLDERDYLAQWRVCGPALAALLYRLSGDEDACRRAIWEIRCP